MGIAALGGIRMVDEVKTMIEQLSEMSDFTARGIKALLLTFIVSFLLGGLVAIVGFTLVVDIMAGR